MKIIKENLVFGSFGNRVFVCDRNSAKNGSYQPIAHISFNRKVKFHTQHISAEARWEIEDFARNGNMAASAYLPDFFALRPVDQVKKKTNDQ